MKKHLYSIVALAVLAGPLALSFDQKIHFWTKWPAAFLAIATVGVLYLLWDILVTHRGDWAFNETYVGKFRLWGLPLGEYLFFVAVPYACLFLYDVVVGYWGSATWFSGDKSVLFSGAIVFLVLAWIFRKHGYTMIAMISVTIFLSTLGISQPWLVGSSDFWIWLGLCFLAFSVVNGIYTALPTIRYNPRAILGIKIGTIPLEDFFYNLSYLGLTLSFYLYYGNLLGTP